MASAKKKGNNLEWGVERVLRANYFDHVQRGSASHGVDVIAARFEPPLRAFIGCKWSGYMPPAERDELKRLAEFWNAIPYITKPVYLSEVVQNALAGWQITSLLDGDILLEVPRSEVHV